MDNNKDGVLEEYKSLRNEIMRRQDARLLVLGFTVTGVGTLMGLTLGGGQIRAQEMNYYAFGLIGFGLVMVMAALVLTIHQTQSIDPISAYIRRFIEPNLTGIRWESRWTRYREIHRSKICSGGLPLGASKPVSLYYGFLALGAYLISFVTGLQNHLLALLVLSLLTVVCLGCSGDLYLRKTRGWKINWDNINE